MDEPALSFEKTKLSPQNELARLFYKEMWDHADKSLIPTIFHPCFTFRGSLGPSLVGYDEFAGYVDWVTGSSVKYDRHPRVDRRREPGEWKDAFPRISSSGGFRCAAKRSSRMVDRDADLHIRRHQGSRPLRPWRHSWTDWPFVG